MFKRASGDYQHGKALIDDLARSFLRGSVDDSAAARNTLGDELADVVSRLDDKERTKLRGYRPDIAVVFQGQARTNYESFLIHAFGR